MAYDHALADRVSDRLTARRVSFATKAMMGGLCFLVDDKMLVGVTKDSTSRDYSGLWANGVAAHSSSRSIKPELSTIPAFSASSSTAPPPAAAAATSPKLRPVSLWVAPTSRSI